MKGAIDSVKNAGEQRTLRQERHKAKKRGGDGHITSPTSDRRVKTLGDQESSKQILARTDQRKHDRKILNFHIYYQHLTLISSHYSSSTEGITLSLPFHSIRDLKPN